MSPLFVLFHFKVLPDKSLRISNVPKLETLNDGEQPEVYKKHVRVTVL